MLNIIKARIQQRYRTMAYPWGPAPELPPRFAGQPRIEDDACPLDCPQCIEACPTQAISRPCQQRGLTVDTGRCIFCRACERVCARRAIRFSGEYRLAAARIEDLIVSAATKGFPEARSALCRKLFARSLKLRQVSAGGCNACEADCNVLTTLAWDIGRLGIQFVASPRHADGLLVTGPVSVNMHEALLKTYAAVPTPKIVIAAGACAISGGIFRDHPEQRNGVAGILPVDLFIPGCPPHPLTILDGLLRLIRF